MKFIELDKHLKDGTDCIYLIEGEDFYARENAHEKIKKALNIEFPEMNYTVFEGGELSSILNACLSVPFMSEKRLVTVREFYPKTKAQAELFERYAANPINETCLVFVNANKGFFDKGYTTVDCSKIDRGSLIKWITVYARIHGKSVTDDNAALIAEYCLDDMSKISREMAKLVEYCESEIRRSDIDELVIKDVEYRVFELSNRLVGGNKVGALEVLDALIASGEEPTVLIAMLYNSFKRMFFALDPKRSDGDTAKYLGVKDYAVKMARKNASSFGGMKLRKAMALCLDADSDIKIVGINKSDRLRLLLLSIVAL